MATMNRFYFGGSDSSGSDLDDDNLPYPKPLTRSSFLTADFDPINFLSSLHNRHQTLEDLRTELRTRSQELNKELLDLVNDNYQDFLSLGSSLEGGEEKVEEVRVGLLGFKREIDGINGKVEERRKEVENRLKERRRVRREVHTGRALLEVDQRLEELEERLALVSDPTNGEYVNGQKDAEFSDSEDDSEDAESGQTVPVTRLQKRVQQYIYLKRLVDRTGPQHPFLMKQEERMMRVRQTLLLDLSSALKQTNGSDDHEKYAILEIVRLYGDMGESSDAIEVLKGWRR
ncbi:hypothetical protein MMC09_001147 [Bachmanniomyces sp. S44760]|nr:hypothetical protein [Bachmanniomyces sp. S44760]